MWRRPSLFSPRSLSRRSFIFTGFPRWLGGKESACPCRRRRVDLWVLSSPGGAKGNPLQDSRLTNPMDQGAWQATVHGSAKSRTWLLNWARVQFYLSNHGLLWSLFPFDNQYTEARGGQLKGQVFVPGDSPGWNARLIPYFAFFSPILHDKGQQSTACGPTLFFVNKVLLAHSPAHLFSPCLWQLFSHRGRVE